MKLVTEKVLQRFGYERLFLISGLIPRRVRVTLPEIMEAGKEEQRIFATLPAVLLHNPKIIYHLDRDLPRFPALRRIGELLGKKEGLFFGVPVKECVKAEETYRRHLQLKRGKQKSLMMNLRLSPQDAENLRAVSHMLGVNNISETIRVLLREKALQLHVGIF